MSVQVGLPADLAKPTLRKDMWWLEPAAVMAGFLAFIVYSTWAAFQNAHYYFEPYLSPFYSPQLVAGGEHTSWGIIPAGFNIAGFRISPAFLILWAPGGFRFTCYYYRKAYYRAFFWQPANCAVRDFKTSSYKGETKFPYLFQNIHRYFFYVAVIFIFLLTYDAVEAFIFPAVDAAGVPTGGHTFGIGVGSIVMTLNVCFLALYTFSCHSCRHVCGGHLDKLSSSKPRLRAWQVFSKLNVHHPYFAWYSLFSVGLTDVYIRLCAMGVIHDFRWVF